MSSRNQAAWWSPIAVDNGKAYVSYLAPNSPQDDVYVASRSAEGVWVTQDTGVDSRYDVGHTQTSLAIDGQGRLNVLYGMHGDSMRMVRSNQPGDIAGGFSVPTAEMGGAFSGGDYTYPNLTTSPNGDIYMVVRDRRSGYSDQNGRLFQFSNDQWSELPPFAGQSGTTVYPDHVVADPNGDLHIIWEWAAGGPQGARHFGSYARYEPDTQQYFRANGTAYPAGPISIADADVFQGLEGSETFQSGVHGFQSAKMMLDESNQPMIAYSYSLDNSASGYEHRFARWDGNDWTRSTVTEGPFDIDKPWLGYSDGVLRYYGAVSPNDPLYTGNDDIFLRVSEDFGATWSSPQQITSGLDIQRPVGVTHQGVDYLYLPDIGQQKLYYAEVSGPFDTPPDTNTQQVINLQHGVSPDTAYEYQHVLIRNDTGNAETPQVDTTMLVGTKANTAAEPTAAGELRSLLQFDLSSIANEVSGADLVSTSLQLRLMPRGSLARIDGSPKIDLYAYGSGFSETNSTWNDPDGDGAAVSGDTTPGGTLGEFLGTLGEIEESTAALTQTFESSPEFVAAVQQALDTDGLLRLILVEDNPDTATRDIAFFIGSTSANPTSLPRLSLVVDRLPGDYNDDGVVDSQDYAVWREALGSSVQLPNESPAATPGEVTQEDYEVWLANYGATSLESPPASLVPEPGALVFAVSLLSLLGWPAVREKE